MVLLFGHNRSVFVSGEFLEIFPVMCYLRVQVYLTTDTFGQLRRSLSSS